MKQFNIMSEHDFDKFVMSVKRYFAKCTQGVGKFSPFTLTSKKYTKEKTPRHHRYYWFCVGHLQKAQKEIEGVPAPKELLHEAVKKACGFTEMINTPKGYVEVTKSLKDADRSKTSEFISFMQYWASEKYNYEIPEADSSVFYV